MSTQQNEAISALLSAYLDNELSNSERTKVDQALATNEDLRTELDQLSATRMLLRALPEVSPLQPLTPKLVPPAPPSRGPRSHKLAMAVAGVAAVWLVILTIGVSIGSLPVVPDVDQLAVQHAAAAPQDMDFVPMTADQIADDPAVMTDIGHGMTRTAIFQADDVVQVRYSDGAHGVSVFHQPGKLDWDALPETGETVMMDDGPVWMASTSDVEVLVMQRGDLVVTVVADADMGPKATMSTSAMIPEVDMDKDFMGRLADAPSNILDRF